MGLLDVITNLSPEQNKGLLAMASQMLQAGGPSTRPVSFGQALGAGLEGYQVGSERERLRKLREQEAAQMAQMRAVQMQDMQSEIAMRDAQRTAKAMPKFSTNVQVGRDEQGKPFSYVLSETGEMKRLDGVLPRDKAELVNLGGKEVAYNPYDLQPGQSFQRTVSPDTQYSGNITMRGQNMTDARQREQNAITNQANQIALQDKINTNNMTKASQVASFDTMLGTLDRLKGHAGLPRSVGIYSKVPTMPGSESANFQAELETFKSQAFIPMVAQLKGMGALSDAEGKKLTAAVGALDPAMSESAFKASIDRVVADMQAARQRVSGGAGATQAGAPAGGKVATLSDIAETARRSGRTTAEVTAALRAKGYTIGGQ